MRRLIVGILSLVLVATALYLFVMKTGEEKVKVTKPDPQPVAQEVRVEDIVVDKVKVELIVGASVAIGVEVKPANATNRTVSFLSSDQKVATVDSDGRIAGKMAGSCVVSVLSFDGDGFERKVQVTVKEKVQAPSKTGGVTYIKGMLVVNKTYALPSTYNPGLSKELSSAFASMKKAAAADGISLFIVSGFRSYGYQASLYEKYVARSGKQEADRYSARPGHSEHQSGLAIDLNSAASSFAGTREAVWLADNSWKYGFIVRYPKGKESVTGYMYEPWHMRYLGKANAEKVYKSGLCLEEYLGIDSKYR